MIHLLSIMDIPVQYVSIFAIGRLQDPSKLLIYTHSPFFEKNLVPNRTKPNLLSLEIWIFFGCYPQPLARDLSLPIVHVVRYAMSRFPKVAVFEKLCGPPLFAKNWTVGATGYLVNQISNGTRHQAICCFCDVPSWKKYVFHLLLPRGSFHRFDMFTAKSARHLYSITLERMQFDQHMLGKADSTNTCCVLVWFF